MLINPNLENERLKSTNNAGWKGLRPLLDRVCCRSDLLNSSRLPNPSDDVVTVDVAQGATVVVPMLAGTEKGLKVLTLVDEWPDKMDGV